MYHFIITYFSFKVNKLLKSTLVNVADMNQQTVGKEFGGQQFVLNSVLTNKVIVSLGNMSMADY